MAVAVAANEARDYIYVLVVQILEGLFYHLSGELCVESVLTVLALRADEVAGVHADTVLDECCYNVRTQTLAITDDGVLGLRRQVVNEVHTEVDALQLFEE